MNEELMIGLLEELKTVRRERDEAKAEVARLRQRETERVMGKEALKRQSEIGVPKDWPAGTLTPGTLKPGPLMPERT